MTQATQKRADAELGLAKEQLARARNSTTLDWDREFAALQEEVANKTQRTTDLMITQRYALYDVASTAGIAGMGLLGLVAAYEAVAIARERAFADVRRTSGFNAETGEIEQLEGLKKELTALTRDMPTDFASVASTAVVGGQAGLNSDEIEQYVEVLTKYSTVSGIASDTAGEKLSKLRNILGLTTDGYALLANSIAFAGAQSAASDAQIIAVAEEIAPYARQAGFAATETIGLATALASLQVPPERARSAFQDMAKSIDGAVATGGEKLRNYAAISNMTVDEFSTMWREKPAEAFQAFTRGFAQVDNATLALRSLGLDGQRVAPVLLSLANGADIVADSFATASEGVSNGFLDKAFAVTVETVAAQIQILVNAVGEFAEAMGGPTLAAAAGLIQALTGVLHFLTDIANSPVGQVLSFAATGATIFAGALLVVIGAAAAAGASFLAIRAAVIGLDGQLTPALAKIVNLATGLFGVTIAAREATPALAGTGAAAGAAGTGLFGASAGARSLRVAITGLLASTGVGLLLTLLGQLGGEALTNATTQDAMAESMRDANGVIGEQGQLVLEDADALREAVDAANEFANANASLEGSLYGVGQSMQKNGSAFDAYSTGGRANMQSLSSAISATTKAAGGDSQLLVNLLLGLRQQLISVGAGADALEMVDRAMAATGRSATEATVTSNSLAVGLQHVEDSADGAGSSLNKMKEEVRTFKDYAGDLSSIFARSFEIRFGSQQAYDGILSKFSQMRKDAKDAASGVQDLRDEIAKTEAELRGIAGDRKGLEYGLSIATEYGDTIRTAQIAGEMARLSAQEGADKTRLSELNQDLVEQQEALNRSLLGNSDAAINNRANLDALIQSYGGYLTALASSGASQEVLAAESARLREEFNQQAAALGFPVEQIEARYAPVWSDFATIIREFPPNVNVDITGLDAAEAALKEFLEAHKNDRIDISVKADRAAATAEGTAAGELIAEGIKSGISSRSREGGGTFPTEVSLWDKTWSNAGSAARAAGLGWLVDLMGGAGYAEGGYTGDGGKHDAAGIVHRGEYVSTQEDVRYWGVETFAKMHRIAQGGYSGGGLVGGGAGAGASLLGGGDGYSRLHPNDIQAIADAISDRPAVLMADSRILAQTVGAGNAAHARSS
jgi:TP901 family phage tail tape measure protein